MGNTACLRSNFSVCCVVFIFPQGFMQLAGTERNSQVLWPVLRLQFHLHEKIFGAKFW